MLTTLDALLLFLASDKGHSGYDIRQLFQATPLGIFSDSPGAVYPALARLEARGLLSAGAAEGARRKRLYRRTPAGEAALIAWLKAPIDSAAVERRQQELDLRFVLIGETLGRPAALAFVGNLAGHIEQRLQALAEYRQDQGGALSQTSADALELGARLLQTRLAWCRELLS